MRLASLSSQRFPHVVQMAAPLAACSSEDAYYRRGIDLLVHGTIGLART